MLQARADLSRRAVVYALQGLSFREYLHLVHGINLPACTLAQVLEHTTDISHSVCAATKPLPLFQNYLREGYFPFVQEGTDLYPIRLAEVINFVLEVELPLLRGVEMAYTPKLKQLLLAIAESAPFVPNISQLSQRTGINRNTLVSYLHYLQEAHITQHLYKTTKGITRMQKPDKIFLENTNLAYALGMETPDRGNLRETFFANQIEQGHDLTYPEKGDFLVDGHWLFEVGGANKSTHQLRGWPAAQAFLALDDLEFGHQQKIPLWQFGLLY
jgi:predicted AAA+ superfamily ATPase